jgi:hypothetical protein
MSSSSTKKASGRLTNLAQILGVQKTPPVAKPTKGKQPRKATPRAAEVRPGARDDGREQIAIRLPLELAKRLRTAVYYTPGETVTSFIERAVGAELARVEAKHGPFGEAGQVKRGRPARR